MSELTKEQAASMLAEIAREAIGSYRESAADLLLEYGEEDGIDKLDSECDRLLSRVDYLLGVVVGEVGR